MKEIRLNEEEFKELVPHHMEHVIHTESSIFDMVDNPDKILKIYNFKDVDYLNEKKKNVDYLIEFNKAEKINEIVMPVGLIYLNDVFIGEVLPKIYGHTVGVMIYDNDVPFNAKIRILENIGKILYRIQYSHPKFNACFADVHTDNFMVLNNDVLAIDTSSMKIYDAKGVSNFYLYQLGTMDIEKYELDEEGIVKPDKNTDIYCYIMMILKFLSGSDLYILNIDNYEKYLDRLVDYGFDDELVNCFRSIYDEEIDNINPLVHLHTLYDLDERKLTLARKIF